MTSKDFADVLSLALFFVGIGITFAGLILAAIAGK